MMSNLRESFNNLSEDEQETILDFLYCFTQGDTIKIASEMLFDRSDIKRIDGAIRKFQENC